MIPRPESEVRAAYSELLAPDDDEELVWVAQALDAAYRLKRAPAALRSTAPRGLPGRRWSGLGVPHDGRPELPMWEGRHDTMRPKVRITPVQSKLSAALLSLVVVALLMAASATLAHPIAPGVTQLGSPTNAVSTLSYFPLSGFHHVGKPLKQRGRPELLFIGTLHLDDRKSAVERWPTVKALEQFGTFSNVRAVERSCSWSHNGPVGPSGCSYPTFDWSRAQYRSNYVTFAHIDLLTAAGKPLQPLSGQALQLYNRYARIRSRRKHDPYDVLNTVLQSSYRGNTSRGLPLVATGGYLQTQSQVLAPGDFEAYPTPLPNGAQVYTAASTLPFATARDSLLHARNPAQAPLVEDVNAEANIITALICHADGKKPATVCNRPVIKAILKHVK